MKLLREGLVSGLILAIIAAVAYLSYETGKTMRQTRVTMAALQGSTVYVTEVAEAEAEATGMQIIDFLDGTKKIVNKQLTETNRQIALGRAQLLQQAKPAIDAVTLTAGSATTLLGSANTIVNNQDIPKVIRSARITVDAFGQASIHLEGMANRIDQATPGFLKSAQQLADSGVKLAASGDKIAGDFQVVTDKAVAPKPFLRQLAGYAGDFVKIGSVFF